MSAGQKQRAGTALRRREGGGVPALEGVVLRAGHDEFRPPPGRRLCTCGRHHRARGSVLVMVVGILAMLFIIGSTLLIVSRFERQTVDTKRQATERGDGTRLLMDSILRQLRLEVVGYDGVPYNAGWHRPGASTSGDVFEGEKYATFPGWYGDPWAATAAGRQARIRSGSGLLSSNEPFFVFDPTTASYWSCFALSADQLFAPAGSSNPGNRNWRIPATGWGAPAGDNDAGDADGDGVPDSLRVPDRDFETYLRVVSNGGMVLLDPLTHPALLAQVIHPKDLNASGNPTRADLAAKMNALRIDPVVDEPRLRRRWWLPGNVGAATLDPAGGDPRRVLPRTLGVKVDAGAPAHLADRTPHWEQLNPAQRADEDRWWKTRMSEPAGGLPPLAPTDPAYDASIDHYDRRRLITTISADSLLRPQRDEQRLWPEGTGFSWSHDVLRPGEPNPGWHPPPTQANPNPFDWTPYVMWTQYGRLGVTDPPIYRHPGNTLTPVFPYGSDVFFNTPSARAQFSLRDVLSDHFRDGASNRSVPRAMPSWRRIEQLTAYYLALLQHTTFPGGDQKAKLDLRPPAAGGPPNDSSVWLEQVSAARQLALNTIDFADVGPPMDPLGHNFLCDDDPPTWLPGSSTVPYGVERHPYITEVYARIVQKAKKDSDGLPVNPPEWEDAPDAAESLYAVELYNPYDVPIDLRHYRPNDSSWALTRTDGSSPFIQPYSYFVIVNRFEPQMFASAVATPLIRPVLDENVIVFPQLLIDTNTRRAVTLVRRGALRADINMLEYVEHEPIEVDRIETRGGADPIARLSKPSSWARPRMVPGEDIYDFPAGPCPATADPVPNSSPPYYVRRPGQTLEGDELVLADGTRPGAAGDRLIRDYSLQRHKEYPGRPPVHWHATLSRQILFPTYPAYEYTQTSPCEAMVKDTPDAAVHHNLLWTGYDTSLSPPGWIPGRDAQAVVEREFKGLEVRGVSIRGPLINPLVAQKAPIAGFPVILGRALPETPHPCPAPAGGAYRKSWWIHLQRPGSAVLLVFEARFGPIPPPSELGFFDSSGNALNRAPGPTIASPPPPAGSGLTHGTLMVGSSTSLISSIEVRYASASPGQGFQVKQILDPATRQPLPILAFPTTGSLLLVTRYANIVKQGNLPAGVQAALMPPLALFDPPVGHQLIQESPGRAPGMLQRVDNGHMPLWDWVDPVDPAINRQVCTDSSLDPRVTSNDTTGASNPQAQASFDMPWGQLVHNYFTALPIEELYYYRDLSVPPFNFTPATRYQSIRLVDLDRQEYDLAYGLLFPGLPVVEPVPGPNGPLAGPRVRGRININTAPWWVLDGLPMMPWSRVPATELDPLWIDPTDPSANPRSFDVFDNTRAMPTPYDLLPGLIMATDTADIDSFARARLNYDFNWGDRRRTAPLDLPSVSPALARAMVAYREMRSEFADISLEGAPSAPGFQSVGQVADVLRRMKLKFVDVDGMANTAGIALLSSADNTRAGLRDLPFPDAMGVPRRPYAHLGYLQLVAPLVRLEDWATVKDHVFTVYMTQGDTENGTSPVWTHSERTVDRTRCLFTNDLPAIVAETPPVSYYNVVSDQK